MYENSASATPSNNNFKEGVPFQGYSPKNKKLYCYRYRFVEVVNGRGSAAIYKWGESKANLKESLNSMHNNIAISEEKLKQYKKELYGE